LVRWRTPEHAEVVYAERMPHRFLIT